MAKKVIVLQKGLPQGELEIRHVQTERLFGKPCQVGKVSQATLAIYPSDKRIDLGDIDEAEMFMVWAMTRDEPVLSAFGENGYAEKMDDLADQLEAALKDIEADKGMFETIWKVGHRLLQAIYGNPEAEGVAVIRG